MRKSCWLIAIVLGCTAAAAAEPSQAVKSPVSPAESLKYLRLPDDLEVQLAAAEPEIVDPVDMRFDELGRMYVVEMRDYPLGPKTGEPPLSRIKLLEDTDGDGRFETAHVFADKLSFATGLQPWRGGVIVTLAGRVAYFKDTDGDHRADLEETWFTGFAQENAQLRANHPRFAHDNHIYIANGLRGGKLVDNRRQPEAASSGRSPDRAGDQPIDISGRDFRFDPRGSLAEAVSGVGQYGLCFDDFGQRFVCQNRNPLQHVVFEERDLKKSKHYTPPAVMNDVAAAAEKSKLFPLIQTWTTSNLHENTFTAACGVNIYRGTALPEQYHGIALTCDPTGNLVHAERMEPWGPTFRSKPLYDDREFLASTDEWFRPVSIENGPDGALYVVDMYRAVIEHPDWVPDELKHRPDERFGDDRGRIYRIVPKEMRRPKIDLPGKASPAELVQILSHRDAWQRETAQRLLIERGDKDVEGELAKLLEDKQPETAFHALWTLQGLGVLNVEHLKVAERREEPSMIRAVARLYDATGQKDVELRTLIVSSRAAGAFASLAPLSADESYKQAHRVACFADDPWSQYELLLGTQKPICITLTGALDDERGGWVGVESEPHYVAFARELGRLSGLVDDPEPIDLLLSDMNKWWTKDSNGAFVRNGLLGLAEGLDRRGNDLSAMANNDDAKTLLSRAVHSAALGAANLNVPTERRVLDIELLRLVNTDACRQVLQKLTNDQDQTIRIAAIRAVLTLSDEQAAAGFLGRARAESPAVKRVILEGLIGKPATLALLLEAIEKSELQTSDVEPALVPRVINVADPQLKARAQKLFAPPPDADREKLQATYATALKTATDSKVGKAIFEKNCATCHRIGELGVNVAPDISDSRTKTPQQLLVDILQPNRAVDGNYVAYLVTTNDGKLLTGVISTETAQAITLKQPGGQSVVVPRSEIEELASTGKSLMPEGLERTIPPEQMAELIAFIKNWRYLDGRVPASGVTPR